MIEIRNLKFQPLTLHVANSKRSVHLAARGKVTVDAKDVSAEIRGAAQKGFVALRELKPSRPAAGSKRAPAVPAEPKAPAKPDVTTAKDKKERG